MKKYVYENKENRYWSKLVEWVQSRDSGFSMLELMVYVAIVGVLMAVAVPRYTSAITMANTARVQSDLQSINAAIAMYHADTGKYPSSIQDDLSSYLMNTDDLKPPTGSCQLRSGDTLDLNEASYGLASDGHEASCGGHGLADFGRGNSTEAEKPKG